MARTVDSPIYIPQPRTQAGSEIADIIGPSNGTSGIQDIYAAINGTYENMRGQMLMDFEKNTGGIIDTVGDIARYRCRTFGEGGLTDETIEVWARLFLAPTGGGQDFSLKVTEVTTGNTFTYQDISGASVSAWVNIGSLVPEDTIDYNDLEFEITVDTGFTTSQVEGLAVYYTAPKSSLTAVTAGSETYANGFVPLEISQAAGEKPLSTHSLMAAHRNLIELWEDRVGQVVCTWTKAQVLYNSANGGNVFTVIVPARVTQIRFWVYGRTDNVSTAVAGTLNLRSFDSGETASDLLTTLAWYGPTDLNIGGPFKTPVPRRIDVTGGLIGVRLHGLCAFFKPASY